MGRGGGGSKSLTACPRLSEHRPAVWAPQTAHALAYGEKRDAHIPHTVPPVPSSLAPLTPQYSPPPLSLSRALVHSTRTRQAPTSITTGSPRRRDHTPSMTGVSSASQDSADGRWSCGWRAK